MRYLRFLAVFAILWVIFAFATGQLILMNYSAMGALSSAELAGMTSVTGLLKAGAYAFVATVVTFFTFKPSPLTSSAKARRAAHTGH